MINGQLKSKIDKLWEEFWTGGITNPLTVIEQITYLMYARMLDMNERNDEKRSARTGKPFLVVSPIISNISAGSSFVTKVLKNCIR